MSTNAGSWFYREPEHRPYLISERLNGTFWQARIVGITWRCVSAEPPFRAVGYWGEHQVEMSWEAGQWLALKVPPDVEASSLVEAVSKRVLAMPAALTYGDSQGHQITEWRTDGGDQRWSDIQGKAGYVRPRRL